MTLFVGPVGDSDKYELVDVRSRGGEGEVWRATVTIDSVRVPVALKIILPDNADDLDTWHDRWLRQAELLKSVSHPGLMRVREVFFGPFPHDQGAADPVTRTLCLVMNWVEGESLPEWVERRTERDVLESLRIVGGLASAVDYLHGGSDVGQGILHRDIKPANVIVTIRGPVLVDFGFVRIQGSDAPMTMVGSPAYLAPEAAAGLGYHEASDLYSLGATAFFAVTGSAPTIDDPQRMLVALDQVKGLEGRGDVQNHLLAMLSRDPSRRPSSAVDWAQGLATLSIVGGGTRVSARMSQVAPATAAAPTPSTALAGESKARKRWLVPVLGLVALALAGVAIGWVLSKGDQGGSAAAAASDSTTVTVETQAPSGGVMPNLVGVPEADAVAQLAELGVTDVTIETRPSDAEPGVVVEQSVASGTELGENAVVHLVVSEEQMVAMPDLVGVSRSEAEAMLSGFGIVDVVEQDSALAPGTVIEQQPIADSVVAVTQPVMLVVARETATPDFSEMTLDEATALVTGLGGEVETVSKYRPEGTTGDFMSQSPEAGAPLTPTVTLTIVEGPGSILLEDMEALQLDGVYGMRVGFGQGDSSGTTLIHALRFADSLYSDLSAGLAEYNLGKDFDRLRATVGYDDTALADGEMRLEVYGDGTLLFSNDYGLGESEDVLIDISDVLRLEIRATTLCCDGGGLDEVLLLGQIELLGPPSVVAVYRNTGD